MSNFLLHYKCIECGKEIPIRGKMVYTCPDCNNNLDIIYDIKRLKKEIKKRDIESSRDYTIFRYAPFLPLDLNSKFKIPANVGWTPVFEVQRLRKELCLKKLFIKDDGRNPSASFKDRASAIGILRALELGEKLITAASTGNAASSLSCLSSALGIKNVIFLPESAPRAKIAQLLIFGAKVITVKGTYDNAFDLSWEATKRFGWYSRNTGINPYLSEGKKTGALEICEQFNWKPPDYVFIPVGDGCIIGGIHKGFKDFYDVGFIKKIPKIIAVQAKGSAAIYRAWKNQSDIKPISAKTLADSISVDFPRDGKKAIRAIRDTHGDAVMVSDKEILAAQELMARLGGVFGEPAGAAALAGVIKFKKERKLKPTDSVLAYNTGNGLKDIEAAFKAVKNKVIPSKKDFKELNRIKKLVL